MTYQQVLRHLSASQSGYVTVDEAHQAGVPAVELRKLATRGALEHIARGLYRLSDVTPGPDDLFLEAVLRAGPDAVLVGDAVLALHQLAQVAPRRIKVATPRRVRLKDPGYLDIVTRHLARDEITVYRGIRSCTVTRALLDCLGTVMPERLLAAVTDAARRDLLTVAEAAKVRSAIRKPVNGR